MKIILLFLFCLSASAADFKDQIKPFINKYCIDCHGPKKEKGDLRLDTLKTDFSDSLTAENWQHVLDELNGATMPPEDEAQPNSEELTAVLELLTYELELAKKKLYGKDRKVTLRKLNKREYIQSIFDMTGMKLPEHEVPNDSSSSEFDTNGDGLFMSAYLLNKYRQLGESALSMAIKADANFKPKTQSVDHRKKRQSKNVKILAMLDKAWKNAQAGNNKPPKGITKGE
ncbi:MAG: DUF1587 domain-containing protein, partial [Lentisphaeraceae bacterium]|nr:DUF1587 domain-containing protein [Lentisphaeraceae bacterium]